MSTFIPPEEIKKQYPELVGLILGTEAMDIEEKQYWITLLPSIGQDRRDQLFAILDTERRKLEELYNFDNIDIEELDKYILSTT